MSDYYAPAFEVKIEGLTMEADVTRAVIDLSYESSLDTADMVTLRLNNAGLRLTDSALFDVGKNVEVYMGYAGNLQPMMLGEITAVNPDFPESGAPTLTVTAYDKSHRMRHNHKLRTFPFASVSLIAAQIAAENLLIPVVDPTPSLFENKTQNSSDMAFLKELAERTFFDVYVNWNRLHFQFPRPQLEAVCLEWGKNLSSFSPRLATSGQAGAISVFDYDQELGQAIVGLVPVISADFDLESLRERLGSAFVEQLINLGTKYVTGQSANSFPDALTLAKAVLSQILEGMFEGHGACIGIPELRAGKMVEISGVGRRFSGKYRLSNVTHTIGESGYRTTFGVTQRNSGTILQLARRFLVDEPPPNKRKKMEGSVPAEVINNVDSKNLGRVLVRYPGLGVDVMNWATVIPPDIGVYFMPDIGDTVLVDFEDGDLDRPVVKGRKWNVKQKPPESPTPTNFKRFIQSRTGHKFVLDDTPGAGKISLSTPAGSEIYLDEQGNIEAVSSGQALIRLNADGGVQITAPKYLELTSNGDITIAANNVKVKVAGTMDVS
jgi:phage protein D/phage baseplate assembly protein gpV